MYNTITSKVFNNMTGRHKTITLYETFVKWGTHGRTSVYLFDEPKVGLKTKAIKWCPNMNLPYEPQYDITITEIRDDGFILVEMD